MKNILEWVKDILIAVVIAGVIVFQADYHTAALHGTELPAG